MLHSRLADRTIGGETIFLLIHWSSDTLNTVQEIARQSLQEIREHTRSMISDPRALPYYVLAAGAIVTSIGLYFAGRKHESLFFALWPPTILTMAILNVARFPRACCNSHLTCCAIGDPVALSEGGRDFSRRRSVYIISCRALGARLKALWLLGRVAAELVIPEDLSNGTFLTGRRGTADFITAPSGHI
jgi:hypothetical protein